MMFMPFKTGSWGKQAKERSHRRKEYFRKYQKERYRKKRDEILAKQKQCNLQNPEKIKARNLAKYHVEIPQGQICQNCKIALATEKHHPDYTKPLQVKFFCVSCNRKTMK